ncbi:MAG: molybdopterin molybdotransferase MoeA [Geothrix sp.]|uniref:molybdopterin molybdotransferase MoeA n=1 Tax=Geothrix sp. TaxID=1962974 RepID=UPI00180D1AB9|nr:gephyrin-like molybdotransferase Glp [Geothrix sp.]NWJ40740.1 molybdopterin molybdotransferase MoeA [Geothrix sp.]WIL21254.1 MAG: molybdopterin molybdotransferase MoeA [Geothrix sp.]
MPTPAEALALILDRVAPRSPRRLPLEAILGMAAAEDLVSTATVPPFTNSAMDGYAVRAMDLADASPEQPVRLRVLGDLAAGGVPLSAVGPGEALRIMTGAPMPEGADSVVPVEDTTRGEDWVETAKSLRPGIHIRLAGEDLRAGQLLVKAGQGLRPGDLGVLAAAGIPTVSVHPRVRVAVLTTGDELVDVSEEPGPGRIRDANIHAVCAQVSACGAIPAPFPRVPDDRATLMGVLRQALEADVVLTTGGISVGDYDFMKAMLEELGAERIFWKVAQKPGGPLGFWMLGSRPIFGIPGNPVAAMLMVEEYVRPALRKLMGFAKLHRPVAQARLEDGWTGRTDQRTTFLRVVARREADGLHARTTGPQGSAILSSMLSVNALAVIPEGVARVEPGGTVQLHLTEEAEDH